MTTYPVTLTSTAAPVLAWADESTIEEAALQQLRDVSQLPGLHGLRVMPDVHFGKGATVGSVIAMEQALAPAAVGVDIGCGVNAVKTSLHLEDLTATDLARLRSRFEAVVPVGFGAHSPQRDSRVALSGSRVERDALRLLARMPELRADVTDHWTRAVDSMGTLGGGNHFIELTTDEADAVWITLHSGSRGIGNTLAQRHMAIARDLPENQDLPDHLRDLSLFYKGTPEMDAYLHDLRWAQEYAMHSRTIMMELVKRELDAHFANAPLPDGSVFFGQEINCHHNYVAEEVIDGKPMIVTRKGAISARSGELALIPGSMATGSYIVRGLGNPQSFYSASHGAGRRMSRNAAKKRYTAADVAASMVGIEARTDEGVVDEITYAYKDLDSVIAAQQDLVQPVARLKTILCVKG